MIKGQRLFTVVAAALCGVALARPLRVLAPERMSALVDLSRLEVPTDRYLDLGASQGVAETSGYRASPWPWQTEARRVEATHGIDEGRYVDLGALAFSRDAGD